MTDKSAARVTVEEGVVFGTGGGRELRCDVFTPPAGTANGVGVLLVHGGGWFQGDRTQLRGYGILLGRLGYTCVASEYRLSQEAKWPAQIHDVKAALRWMRANSGRLGFDARKTAISGNSAGAHLALMAAATPNRADLEGDGGNSGAGTEVVACIAFYAPTNLMPPAAHEAAPTSQITLPDAIAMLFGADSSAARVRDASPINYAHAAFPPTLLFTGNRDDVVPAGESLRMYEVLTRAGASAELHVYEGAPHAFDAIPEFGRQCAGVMQLFLDRHVVRPRRVVLPAASAGA